MAQDYLTKEEIEKLLATPGKVRGVVFQTDAEYVRNKKGKDGVAALEKELARLGCPIDYGKIKAISWYPLGLRVVSLLVIKNIFDLKDEDIEEMGNLAPKYSLIVKLLMKYFLTIDMTYRESPKYWEKHYTVGRLETPGYSLKEKYFIVRIVDFKVHPILCVYFRGYFKRISQFLLQDAKIFKTQETKCLFRGDPYHEILITWE